MPRSALSEHYRLLIEKLREARVAAGVQQTVLAQRLGKPQSFVSKVERCERRLDAIEFVVVASAIGVDGVELIRKVTERLPPEAAF